MGLNKVARNFIFTPDSNTFSYNKHTKDMSNFTFDSDAGWGGGEGAIIINAEPEETSGPTGKARPGRIS